MKKIISVGGLLILGCCSFFALKGGSQQSVDYQLGEIQVKGQQQMKNGEFSGKGTVTFANGNSYVGEFTNGYFDGKGKFISKTWQYEGEFNMGITEGKGALTTKSGERYTGEFKDGVYQVK
ncbi:MORN repeat-containing protein [Enterococcus massiliensis]|uniref:hypothetical protein n=1 Tax=Enterococcus massiliensis TaxID=1640685 RepID=UPI00069E223B|nr:hypothetical protein [Enterococcus massiliensis]